MASDPHDDQHGDRRHPDEQDAPTGGSETTEDQLDADNAVEEDMLKAVGPDASPD